MSGNRKGLQKLLPDHCLKLIYIHCFAHRLNLVVKNVIDGISDLKEYFGTVSSIYSFFKLSNARAAYNGTSLKRLVDTRWSRGHLDAAKSFEKNDVEIRKTLKSSTTNKKLEQEQRALADGLLTQLSKRGFVSLTCYVGKILKIMDILNKILQSSIAFVSLECCTIHTREVLRNELSQSSCQQLLQGQWRKEQCKGKRSREIPAPFSEFIIMDLLPGE